MESIKHFAFRQPYTVTFRYSNSCVQASQDRRLYEKVQTLERLKECQAWDSSDFAAPAILRKKRKTELLKAVNGWKWLLLDIASNHNTKNKKRQYWKNRNIENNIGELNSFISKPAKIIPYKFYRFFFAKLNITSATT